MPAAARPRTSRAKRAFFRLFLALERLGVHVLPRHFYSPVADRRALGRDRSSWRRPTPLTGVEWDLDAQLRWVEATCAEHLDEVRGFSFLSGLAERGIEFRYGPVEGQVLHCAVRSLASPLIVEVGSGASTALIADAAARNEAEGRGVSRIVSIDPYAPPELARLPNVELVGVPVQRAPAEPFEALSEGDLLFIDSTHVLKTGSDLPRIYLELLPSLPAGVTLQVHDVYLPYLYSPAVLSDLWDWQETALLAALLTNNPRLEVLCCQSALHDAMPERLRTVLPDYEPRKLDDGIDTSGGGHFPASIWLRTR